MRSFGALATALVLAGCATGGGTSTVTRHTLPGESRPGTSSARPSAGPASGLPTCDLADLPSQARDTARLIVRGGPFPYRRNDGVTYYNRSKALPKRATGAYREFTVKTPGAPTRGTRRLVTDGNPTSGAPTTSPSAWYYTDDHYTTFCSVTGTS